MRIAEIMRRVNKAVVFTLTPPCGIKKINALLPARGEQLSMMFNRYGVVSLRRQELMVESIITKIDRIIGNPFPPAKRVPVTKQSQMIAEIASAEKPYLW
jgi:hypothetical protein